MLFSSLVTSFFLYTNDFYCQPRFFFYSSYRHIVSITISQFLPRHIVTTVPIFYTDNLFYVSVTVCFFVGLFAQFFFNPAFCTVYILIVSICFSLLVVLLQLVLLFCLVLSCIILSCRNYQTTAFFLYTIRINGVNLFTCRLVLSFPVLSCLVLSHLFHTRCPKKQTFLCPIFSVPLTTSGTLLIRIQFSIKKKHFL